MLGKNLMWCARQHGHSVQVMLTMYGAWINGSADEDVAAIKRSMEAGPMAAAIRGLFPVALPYWTDQPSTLTRALALL